MIPPDLYREAKERHPGMILMFRVGDFYELFDADAETAARVLGLSLTIIPLKTTCGNCSTPAIGSPFATRSNRPRFPGKPRAIESSFPAIPRRSRSKSRR